MEQTLEIKTDEAWRDALDTWNSPSIPRAIFPKTEDEMKSLGDIGAVLQSQLAFMKFPEFQTYVNTEKIEETFKEVPTRGLRAVTKHEIGHRFCPYDLVTSIILRHNAKKELEQQNIPYSPDSAANLVMNLFTDMCINTRLTKAGDQDILWTYQQLSKEKADKKLWRVYAESMGLAWDQELLPKDTKLTDEEQEAAQEISNLFQDNPLNKSKWGDNIRSYTRIISPFLEDEEQDKDTCLDDTTKNIPQNIDEKTVKELAKRLAEIGSNALPTNPQGLKEFKDIMAGFGKGDPKRASIEFYDKLSDSYDVMFATRPFGRSRVSPFNPVRWNPSMDAGRLDVDYSMQVGGRLIPGVNTYAWDTRRRETKGGLEEVVPDLEVYIDSSGSMPDPTEKISLPVLSGFVAAKKAHRKGAMIKSTNFSGDGQYKTQEWTRSLDDIFENFAIYFNGGTGFPVNELLDNHYPKQVLVITDTFLANEQETAEKISELKKRDKRNKVTIYALSPVDNADYLRKAGAEVIQGTTTDIFKKIIGKADEVYLK